MVISVQTTFGFHVAFEARLDDRDPVKLPFGQIAVLRLTDGERSTTFAYWYPHGLPGAKTVSPDIPNLHRDHDDVWALLKAGSAPLAFDIGAPSSDYDGDKHVLTFAQAVELDRFEPGNEEIDGTHDLRLICLPNHKRRDEHHESRLILGCPNFATHDTPDYPYAYQVILPLPHDCGGWRNWDWVFPTVEGGTDIDRATQVDAMNCQSEATLVPLNISAPTPVSQDDS